MANFALTNLTRDSFIVTFNNAEYNINGERGLDVWDVFPKMVYSRGSKGEEQRIGEPAGKGRFAE